MDENERAPKSIMEAAARAPPRVQQKQEISTAAHRYFRIPFMRANGETDAGKEKKNPISSSTW